MPNTLENINPRKNPMTSWPGVLFILISGAMYLVKYIIPLFFVLKQDIPYTDYTPLWPLGIGILLIFINDAVFGSLFQWFMNKFGNTQKKPE